MDSALNLSNTTVGSTSMRAGTNAPPATAPRAPVPPPAANTETAQQTQQVFAEANQLSAAAFPAQAEQSMSNTSSGKDIAAITKWGADFVRLAKEVDAGEGHDHDDKKEVDKLLSRVSPELQLFLRDEMNKPGKSGDQLAVPNILTDVEVKFGNAITNLRHLKDLLPLPPEGSASSSSVKSVWFDRAAEILNSIAGDDDGDELALTGPQLKEAIKELPEIMTKDTNARTFADFDQFERYHAFAEETAKLLIIGNPEDSSKDIHDKLNDKGLAIGVPSEEITNLRTKLLGVPKPQTGLALFQTSREALKVMKENPDMHVSDLTLKIRQEVPNALFSEALVESFLRDLDEYLQDFALLDTGRPPEEDAKKLVADELEANFNGSEAIVKMLDMRDLGGFFTVDDVNAMREDTWQQAKQSATQST